MAGGLAQHIAYGFHSETELEDWERDEFATAASQQWQDSLALFSTPQSLISNRLPLLALS
jgi:hypothetical protein